VAAHVIEWLTDAEKHARRVAELAKLKAEIAHGGASATAADYILDMLAPRGSGVARPHFAGTKKRSSVSGG